MNEQNSTQGQNQGQSSGVMNPNLMLGLALMTAGNAKDPQAAIFSALNQMQQAQQFAAQQKMQQQQLALNQAQLGIEQKKYGLQENADKRQADEVKRSLQAGQNISQAIGQAPSAANGWKPVGLIGEKSDMANNAALYNENLPNQLKGSVFDVPQKLVQTNIDPVTRAKYEFARALGESGKVEQAASVFDAATPKPFSLSPGQQQFTSDGKLVAENKDTSKIDQQANTLRSNFTAESDNFQQISNYHTSFNASKQDVKTGNDPLKDIGAVISTIKMIAPNVRLTPDGALDLSTTQGVPDQLINAFGDLSKTNGVLEPTMRQYVYDYGDQLYKSHLEKHKVLENKYKKLAKDFGVPENKVIVSYDDSNQVQNTQQVRKFNPKTGRIE